MAESTSEQRTPGGLAVFAWTLGAGLICGALLRLSDETQLSLALSQALAQAVYSMYQWLGMSAYLSRYTVTVNGFSMSLPPVCLAGGTLAIAVFLPLVYPGGIVRKLVAAVLLVVVLSELNFVRLVILGHLGSTDYRAFEFAHLYGFQAGFILAVLLGWELSSRWIDRGRKASPDAVAELPSPIARVPCVRVLALGCSSAVLTVLAGLLCLSLLGIASQVASLGVWEYQAVYTSLALLVVGGWLASGGVANLLLLAANGRSDSVRAALWRSWARLPDLLRAGLYSSLWPWRVPVLPGAILAACRTPGLSGREAFLRGWEICRSRRSWLVLEAIAWAAGTALLLAKLDNPDSIVQGLAFFLVAGASLWLWAWTLAWVDQTQASEADDASMFGSRTE